MINFFKVLKWSLLISILILLIKYSNRSTLNQKIKINHISIESTEEKFLTDQNILKYIKKLFPNFGNTKINSFQSAKLEAYLMLHPAIKNAEVYFEQNGKIGIVIEQKKAVVRIKTLNDDYYLDECGEKMKLCENYFPKLIVASGNISPANHKQIFDFIRYLNKSNFWNAQICQIYFAKEDIFLIPNIGNHKINIGNFNNISSKLDNLYKFYTKAISNKGWQTYSEINLKFNNQIVCIKR